MAWISLVNLAIFVETIGLRLGEKEEDGQEERRWGMVVWGGGGISDVV